ncbi:MAG: glycolate oxidase iron-sulfur subunit [Betaproteobacteria bacterium]|nr:glycolate oxidase iron-sulfur subunit [Betaproteobacteria bacterium]
METHLADWLQGTRDGDEAEAILRRCVHCGFCTATCPTYQLLGDELDGPRGRIYLIKQVVEGVKPTAATQLHLDRCLTCRNCETTCPSGVEYGRLIDIGRRLVDAQVERPAAQRAVRGLLQETLTRRWVFDPAMRVGQAVREVLPATLKAKVPARRSPGVWPTKVAGDATVQRRVFLINSCVQPAMMPSIDAATARVLAAIGVNVSYAQESGCCGAIRHHLDDHNGALEDARRNVDAWFPALEAQAVEAIVVNASGCGAVVKEYGHWLADDPAYADRAQRVSESVRDLGEFLATEADRLGDLIGSSHSGKEGAGPSAARPQRIAFHPPCTLQHGQKLGGVVEALLDRLLDRLADRAATLTADPKADGLAGSPVAKRVAFSEAHLCCGSAGTYSVLQPEISGRLRDRKLANIDISQPDLILSANLGCITHLQNGTVTPIQHWVEWLDGLIQSP